MSENQIRAVEYSKRCELRRQRIANRRVERFNKMVDFTISFAAGVMAITLMVAIAIQ